jgi:hypothetical protein
MRDPEKMRQQGAVPATSKAEMKGRQGRSKDAQEQRISQRYFAAGGNQNKR